MFVRSVCILEVIKFNFFLLKLLYELYEYIESCLLLIENFIINRDLKSYYYKLLYIDV